MMGNMLEYKGYHTKVEFDAESKVLRGIIEGINDYIDFESDSIQSITEEFHRAVDDYLEFCKEVGKEPEKEYRGSFNIRISSELHRKMALHAFVDGVSLNSEIEKAIAEYVEKREDRLDGLSDSVSRSTKTVRMAKDNAGIETDKKVDSNSAIIIPLFDQRAYK